MSVKTSCNNVFSLFNSCCASGNTTKQEGTEEDFDEQNFKQKLEQNLDVIVLLEDGTKLSCTLHVNCETSLVRIACDKQVREIDFGSVKKILHTKDELSRIQTNGNTMNFNTTVAFHLLENGNCIPVSFSNTHEKKMFLNILGPFIPT
ncbi:conserved hypothetical protein [Theileria orientalis strain Shintoku]|uniref:ISP3 C-terminal domain-containing protein n=1 Tax=Theileria orientalis strain Shintoku TaxID=869250 RepID=J7M857_THEOR|nr:conserved hypothetical protein [Theileria orientalis strain Shintoku]BAM38633.1 conserved hypothetical protein [Theileria orientalis strain Shintoku]|eukprot:XP_009688934.1 conserved hypothetical protein [Theileria orientalis strain Shintoku]